MVIFCFDMFHCFKIVNDIFFWTYFLQVEILENEIVQEKQSLQNCQNLSKDLMKEKAQLEKTIETLRENSERQVCKFLIKHCILKFVNKSLCK